MKKTLTTLLILVMIITSVSIPVLAEVTEPSDRPSASELTDRINIRQELLELRHQVLEMQQAILEQIQANNELRLELIEKLEENRDKLSEESIETLKGLHRQVKAIQQELMDTRGDIHDLVQQLRDLNPYENLDEMKAIYEDIFEIQAFRLDRTQAIGSLLEQMLAIDWP